MNRKYVATLAGVASLILLVGLLIKPGDAVQVPVPGAEGGPLQQLSQEGELRAEARYFADRIEAVAPQVVYLPDLAAPGVRWGGAGDVVVTLPGSPISPARVTAASDTVAVAEPTELPQRARWILAVARRPEGETVSAVGLYGGLSPVECGDGIYQEIVLDIPIHGALAGSGLFDLNGNRLGMIVRCGEHLAALPVSEVDRALLELASVGGRLRRQFGLMVGALDQRMRGYFRVDSGVLVVEVEDGRAAERWGLRPGDIIALVDGQPVMGVEDLRRLAGEPAVEHVITRMRDGQRAEVPTALAEPSATSASGTRQTVELTASAGGVAITNVAAGTAAHRGGLRAGDRIVQVGTSTRPSVATVRRGLARADTVPVFIVLQRGSVRRGVLLSPT